LFHQWFLALMNNGEKPRSTVVGVGFVELVVFAIDPAIDAIDEKKQSHCGVFRATCLETSS
jgi:hypothetical protein